jgi:hypothetical protein
MTYANHRDTENTENAQSSYWETQKQIAVLPPCSL